MFKCLIFWGSIWSQQGIYGVWFPAVSLCSECWYWSTNQTRYGRLGPVVSNDEVCDTSAERNALSLYKRLLYMRTKWVRRWLWRLSPHSHLHGQTPGLTGFLSEGQELQLQQQPFELLATEVTCSSSFRPVGNAIHQDSWCTGTLSSVNVYLLMPADKRCQNL